MHGNKCLSERPPAPLRKVASNPRFPVLAGQGMLAGQTIQCAIANGEGGCQERELGLGPTNQWVEIEGGGSADFEPWTPLPTLPPVAIAHC